MRIPADDGPPVRSHRLYSVGMGLWGKVLARATQAWREQPGWALVPVALGDRDRAGQGCRRARSAFGYGIAILALTAFWA